jgi:hypothetical protein
VRSGGIRCAYTAKMRRGERPHRTPDAVVAHSAISYPGCDDRSPIEIRLPTTAHGAPQGNHPGLGGRRHRRGSDPNGQARRSHGLRHDRDPEHFAVPEEHVELSGPQYLQSTIAQAYVPGATEKIRLNSCVTVLPLQHPIVLAKALAPADWMSSGRMMVTFGVGWLKPEFDLLGVPFRERGRIADEYLAAIIELWTSESPRFEGRYVSFRDIAFEPKPVQKPHLPVCIGGGADPASSVRPDSPPGGGRF